MYSFDGEGFELQDFSKFSFRTGRENGMNVGDGANIFFFFNQKSLPEYRYRFLCLSLHFLSLKTEITKAARRRWI